MRGCCVGLGNVDLTYHNIYPQNPVLVEALHDDLTNCLATGGARIPLVPNPNYDPLAYTTNSGSARLDSIGGASLNRIMIG